MRRRRLRAADERDRDEGTVHGASLDCDRRGRHDLDPRARRGRFSRVSRTCSGPCSRSSFGTFTLRFSTGLTGALLAYYLDDLPNHGGPQVESFVVGLYGATFFAAELVLSPLFGPLADRWGYHRVMQFGPIFGGIAVVLTGITTNLVGPRRHAAARGRLHGRERAVDPRLHRDRHRERRAAARPRRWRASRRRRSPASARAWSRPASLWQVSRADLVLPERA